MALKNQVGLRRFAVVFWGVPFAVEWTDPDLDQQMKPLLLPNWVPSPDLEPEAVFRLSQDEAGKPVLETPEIKSVHVQKPSLVDTLERRLQLYLGSTTKQAAFVHAGAVGWQGGAIVFPASSFSGKSSLTQAFLKAGATYLSDEYAIIDTEGMVNAFPRRLSIRIEDGKTKRVDASREGWPIAQGPLPLRALIASRFEAGATWQPSRISPGQAVMKMLANTVGARAEPQLAMKCLSNAVAKADCFESPRGEAEDTVPLILKALQ